MRKRWASKGLEIVSNFNELQLLSNRHAFRILKEFQKEPMSGVQLADKLGMKTPRTIYYLKKLEKAGLARQVPLKDNRMVSACENQTFPRRLYQQA